MNTIELRAEKQNANDSAVTNSDTKYKSKKAKKRFRLKIEVILCYKQIEHYLLLSEVSSFSIFPDLHTKTENSPKFHCAYYFKSRATCKGKNVSSKD